MDNLRKTRCPACGSEELLRVDLTVHDSPMAFTSCPACESRWWERDGAAMPLNLVLETVGRR